MEKPQYDIEKLIGIREQHRKSYYETLHIGSLYLGKDYLDIDSSRKLIFNLMHDSSSGIIKQTRLLLKHILCCNASFMVPLNKYSVYFIWSIKTIARETNWIKSATVEKGCIKVVCQNVYTIDDYNYYLSLKELLFDYFGKNLTNIVLEYVFSID